LVLDAKIRDDAGRCIAAEIVIPSYAMSDSFVIHLHRGHGADHYDLMIRQGPVLATWQLWSCPAGLAEGEALPARKIHDHRLAYLDSQGPVSGGRGRVARFDRGACRLQQAHDTHWVLDFQGERLAGRYELRHSGPAPADWTFTRLEP
jgi:hypothetical protein